MAEKDEARRAWSSALSNTVARPVIVVVMGVSGSGKTTIAVRFAAALGCQFQEGDDLHPAANVAKMSSGEPLTDADRLPWLGKIAAEIDGWRTRGESGVLACSALKRHYRDTIIGDRADVTLVYLKGSYDLIHRRMAARHEHFRPVALLDSQFAALQEPTSDEHPIVVEVAGQPAEIVAEIVRQLEQRQADVRGWNIAAAGDRAPGRRALMTTAKLEVFASPEAMAEHIADWLLGLALAKQGARHRGDSIAQSRALSLAPNTLVLGRRALRSS